MVGQILTSVKNYGASYYALIPSNIVKDLNLIYDNLILVVFEKFEAVFKELCKDYCYKKTYLELITKGDKKIIGIITETDKNCITFSSDNKLFIVPYSYIQNINEIKRDNK